MKNYTNKNNTYILKISYTSWRTLLVLRFACSYYLNEKYHHSLSPYFRNNPRACKLGLYTRNKKYKVIEGIFVQTMLWSWSLPDWMVVHYVRLVVFLDSSEATVCSFPLDSRVRDYGRSRLHLSWTTKRFWFSSTERNTEFGEHMLLLCMQQLGWPGLERTPYFFA